MPDNPIETKSSAAIAMIAKKVPREEGLRDARRAAMTATISAAAKPTQRQAPGWLAGPKRDHRGRGQQERGRGQCGRPGADPMGQSAYPGRGVVSEVGKNSGQMGGHPRGRTRGQYPGPGHLGGRADRVTTAGAILNATA